MDIRAIIAPFTGPVSAATLAFPLVAGASVLPFALVHYRRHGRVHPWRAFVSYSFAYYLVAALFLVILPLPELPGDAGRAEWDRLYGSLRSPRLDPTAFLHDILGQSNPVKRTRALFQAIFNALLLLPFGAYVVYLFKKKALFAWAAGFLLSLAFELCQLTGDFWIYPGPYRLFDIGDLILNSTGSLAGALLALLLAKLGALPDLERLKGPMKPWIGPFRRGIALIVDGVAFAATTALALVLLRLGKASLPEGAADEAGPVVPSLFALFWFVLLPTLDGGRGLGKRLALCAIRRPDGTRAGPFRILVRQCLIWACPVAALLAAGVLPASSLASTLALLGIIGALAFWMANAFQAAFSKEHAGWLDRRLQTRIMNSWSAPRSGIQVPAEKAKARAKAARSPSRAQISSPRRAQKGAPPR